MSHISSRQVGRVVDLSLMDLSLMRACAPARRRRDASRARDQARPEHRALHDAPRFLVNKATGLSFENEIFMLRKRPRPELRLGVFHRQKAWSGKPWPRRSVSAGAGCTLLQPLRLKPD